MNIEDELLYIRRARQNFKDKYGDQIPIPMTRIESILHFLRRGNWITVKYRYPKGHLHYKDNPDNKN